MANNRMYLLHRPSGKAIFLGKRMARGWYDVPNDLRESIVNLFAAAEDDTDGSQDDFCVALEVAGEGAPMAATDWKHNGKSELAGVLNFSVAEKAI